MKERELPERVEAGSELEVQLAPLGEWPVTATDEKGKVKKLVQVVDAAACAAVIRNFSKDVLVDLDHESVEGSRTRAYAWVTGLRADEKLGLVGTFKFTEAGAEAVNSREYRFVSVSWFLDKDGRPEELDSVALTNRPNLPVRPVLNRKGAKGAENLEQATERTENMDKLKEMLGLPADATGEQVSNAVSGLKERVAKLEAAAKEAEAEKFAAENSAKADKTALKNAYLASPEAAKALVAGIAAPRAQQVLNAAAAQKPEVAAHTKEALAALPPSKRADYYAGHAAEIDG